MAETETLASRDETETLASPAETRPRRDICRSRDMTETLKCTLSCSSKQVNVGLTTVATVTACLVVSWCILDFVYLMAVIMYRLFYMALQPVGTGR